MTDWRAVGDACRFALQADSAVAVAGGSISSAWRVESGRGPVFVKLEAADDDPRLAAEADGLAALAAAKALRVPAVYYQGLAGGQSCLVMEWIEPGGKSAAAEMGEALAKLHRQTGPHFGWARDNFIGSTPQPNTPNKNWVRFLREQRLAFQLSLAEQSGYRLDSMRCSQLLDGLESFYADYQPEASLLHGDLWGGNWFSDTEDRPVIFDPAVYYGDREADLAMTELFGGFGPDFYRAYKQAWPLDAGYKVRRDLHQLYHVLNHLNLFGGGYLGQAEALLARLCSELR